MAEKKTKLKEVKEFTDIKDCIADFNKAMSSEKSSLIVPEQDVDFQTVTRWFSISDKWQYLLDMDALPFGQLMHVYGKKNTGKTSMLMELMATCESQGVIPILMLTEHKYDWNRYIDLFKGDRETVVLYEPEFLEDVFTSIDEVLGRVESNPNHPPVMIFWDSIGGTDARDFDVKDWSGDNGRTAQALKKLMKRLHRRVHRSAAKDRMGFLFFNQAWDKRAGSMTVETPNGGESTQHYYSLEINLKRTGSKSGTVNSRAGKVAEKIKLKVVKNHITGSEPVTDCYVTKNGWAADDVELKELLNQYRLYKKKKGD